LGEDPHGEEVNEAVLKQFNKIVESQTKFNKDGKIHAIPIIGYHKIDIGKDYYTSPELFEKEMEYLHENNFKVITLADLGYDENQERFYIKNTNNIGGSEVLQFQNKTQ
jgi:maleate cis-trans isomerase